MLSSQDAYFLLYLYLSLLDCEVEVRLFVCPLGRELAESRNHTLLHPVSCLRPLLRAMDSTGLQFMSVQ